MQKSHQQLWEECRTILRDNLPEEQFRAWFEPIASLGFEDGKLTLAVPSPFCSEYIENNYLKIRIKFSKKQTPFLLEISEGFKGDCFSVFYLCA